MQNIKIVETAVHRSEIATPRVEQEAEEMLGLGMGGPEN